LDRLHLHGLGSAGQFRRQHFAHLLVHGTFIKELRLLGIEDDDRSRRTDAERFRHQLSVIHQDREIDIGFEGRVTQRLAIQVLLRGHQHKRDILPFEALAHLLEAFQSLLIARATGVIGHEHECFSITVAAQLVKYAVLVDQCEIADMQRRHFGLCVRRLRVGQRDRGAGQAGGRNNQGCLQ